MKYLFKTLLLNNYGTAAYEVFIRDDDSYYCIMSSWKGYLAGPGNVTLRKVGKKWQPDPEGFTEVQQLAEAINQYWNS